MQSYLGRDFIQIDNHAECQEVDESDDEAEEHPQVNRFQVGSARSAGVDIVAECNEREAGCNTESHTTRDL